MKNALLFLLLSLTTFEFALALENEKPYESYQGCGEYWTAGIVRSTKLGYFIVVNEKTQSEYNFKAPILEEPKLAPYVDRPMKAKVVLSQKLNGTRGDIEKVIQATNRVPNPLHPILDTGFRLIKKMECKK